MKAVITGDIVQSETVDTAKWQPALKIFFKDHVADKNHWAIYRGDEFQILVDDGSQSLRLAILIKAFIRSLGLELDARMSIGLGAMSYKSKLVTESNGSAFVRSGRLFEDIKNSRVNMAVSTGEEDIDADINLMLKLGLTIMDHWTQADAELALIFLAQSNLKQQQIAEMLHIKQAGVSRRKGRAKIDLIEDLLRYFEKKHQYLMCYKLVDFPSSIVSEP